MAAGDCQAGLPWAGGGSPVQVALRGAQGLGAGDREQAVRAGLATRRFGDATLAGGWSGESRLAKGEIGRGTMDEEVR